MQFKVSTDPFKHEVGKASRTTCCQVVIDLHVFTAAERERERERKRERERERERNQKGQQSTVACRCSWLLAVCAHMLVCNMQRLKCHVPRHAGSCDHLGMQASMGGYIHACTHSGIQPQYTFRHPATVHSGIQPQYIQASSQHAEEAFSHAGTYMSGQPRS